MLSGHVHEPFVQPPPWGDGLTLSVGAGALSRRTRGTPPCFTVIDAFPDAVEIRLERWTGTRFAPSACERFPRRPALAEERSSVLRTTDCPDLPG
ncbi:hypothetical protein [Methylocella sp.]|uniref:hypothetical protein n=1 Tax=Methylocella sp. TaxID=1978226 RepID=UPI0035B4AB41